MVRGGGSSTSAAPSIDSESTNGNVTASSPPTHDFAFFEWDYRPSAPANVAGLNVDNQQQHLAVEPAVVAKNSIEDLMQPSIYKSLLSREMGGSTDLEPEIFESVPKDVIELEDHKAVGLGQVGTSRSALLQREFAESRLRRTAPGCLLQTQLSGKPSSRTSYRKQPVGRRATHHGVMSRTGGGTNNGKRAASRWAKGEEDFHGSVEEPDDDGEDAAAATGGGMLLHSDRPGRGQALESPVLQQRNYTSEAPTWASARRSSEFYETAATAHPATPGLSVHRLLSKLSLKRKK